MGSSGLLRIAKGVPGPMEACALLPDPGLRAHRDDAGIVWQSLGDHAGLTTGELGADDCLPAGWYEWRMQVTCMAGELTLPCLHLTFAPGEQAEQEEIPLPDPDTQGRVRALVLFKFPVRSLHLCPGVWAARFRLTECSLQRVSRWGAFWRVFFLGRSEARSWRRLLRYAWGTLRRGLSAATARAYADYLLLQRPPGLAEYDVWVRKYDTFTPSRLADMQRRMEALLGQGPSFAVMLRVEGVTVDTARRCIEGVRGQVWPHWELNVVVDASSCTGPVQDMLRDMAASDARLRLVEAPQGRLAEAFNTVLGALQCDHVAVLDASCLLRRHALLEAAGVLCTDPSARWVYGDEDHVDTDGRRSRPFFKPDWDPNLLYGCNYMGCFAVFETAAVQRTAGLREGLADPWHDLFLRCSSHVPASEIRHVPRILWHNMVPVSDTDGPATGDEIGATVVREHLLRQDVDPAVHVSVQPRGGYRVHWPLPQPGPRISLIVPTRDRLELLHPCIQSILERSTWPDYEIVVVDNGSVEARTHAYFRKLRKNTRVRVLSYDAAFNYPAINNFAVGRCDGDLVCLLNNDTEVITPDWLQEMAGHALRPDVGAVGVMLYYPDDTIQHAGVIVGMHGVADHRYAGQPRDIADDGGRARVAQSLSAVTAACLMVRREVYLQAGGLDEGLAVAFNDVDFCLRLRRFGYRNIWTPFAELYHHESATRGGDDSEVEKARFAGEIAIMRERWATLIKSDPAHNPNLSLTELNPGLAFPPRQ